MKKILLLLLSTFSLLIAEEKETEKEWKIIAKAEDHHIQNAASLFLKNAVLSDDISTKEKAVLKRLKATISGEALKLAPKDLLQLKKVRSIQIGKLGVFSYPYFNCWFKQTDRGLTFKKTSGSQRKNGTIFRNDDTSLVFLGAWSVNDDPTHDYSGLAHNKDQSHDSAGLIIKRGKTYLAIFPEKNNAFEIYEFK